MCCLGVLVCACVVCGCASRCVFSGFSSTASHVAQCTASFFVLWLSRYTPTLFRNEVSRRNLQTFPCHSFMSISWWSRRPCRRNACSLSQWDALCILVVLGKKSETAPCVCMLQHTEELIMSVFVPRQLDDAFESQPSVSRDGACHQVPSNESAFEKLPVERKERGGRYGKCS